MCKNYLLSCTAAAAIILFGAHFNVAVAEHKAEFEGNKVDAGESKTYQAESAEKSALYVGEKEESKAVKNGAKKGGQITGKNLTLIGADTKKGKGATVEGSNSKILLKGKTTIKDLQIGLNAAKGGEITMESGTIDAEETAIKAEGKNTIITLGNVDITSQKTGLDIKNGTQITMESGKIDAEETAIEAEGKNTIITLGNVDITSQKAGLDIKNGTQITMESGKIDAKETAIKAEGKNTIITLGNVDITSQKTGLDIKNGTQITMKSGKIDTKETAIEAEGKNTIALGNVDITSQKAGLDIKNGTQITMESGKIDAKETAIEAEGKNTIALGNVDITSQKAGLDIKNGTQITMKSGKIDAKEIAIKADGKNTTITVNNVDITSQKAGLDLRDGAQILANGGSVTLKNNNDDDVPNRVAIIAQGAGSRVTLNNVVISSDKNGIEIGPQAILNMTGGSIEAEKDGISFEESKNNKNKLKDTKITVAKGSGVLAKSSKVSLENISIKSKEGFGLCASGDETNVTIAGGIINADNAAFFVKDNAKINISNVSATASKNGLELENINKEGKQRNVVNFTNTKLTVEKGVGISGNKSGKDIVNLKNSEIHADLLLKFTAEEKKKSAITLNTDHSILEGGVRTGENAETIFNLNNGTIWTLKISKEEKNNEDKLLNLADRARSSVSKLDLNNSTIAFDKATDGQYQTLYVGAAIPKVSPNEVSVLYEEDPKEENNSSKVYKAQGNAKIYFNTEWSSGLKTKDQKTDRLVVNGDALGTTTVYVNTIKGNNKTEENASVPKNESGISLIQVSGEANKDSFKLANGYTTINNAPYKYTLNAYDPETSSHEADQSMFGSDKPYWDFRLQNAYLDSQSEVKALVPQMASYLVMPNALFSAGFSDISEQNKALTDMRAISLENTFFLSSYGSTATVSSNHSALEYGYGANIRYGGVQAGVALGVLENQNTTTRFGLLGTYGQLSFTPKDMEGATKSTLDKWSISAFGSMQNRNGLYLNALFSYGLVKGHIKIANIGNIAKLNDVNTLSTSAIIGQQFTTSIEGLTFEPQAQLAYQRLMFDNISDGNDLEINMNNPHQWLVRIGGRLTKTIAAVENGHAISLYGKLDMINTFGDGDTIQVSDSFRLDPMGASVAGGIGINAQLNQKIGLHGDVSHQHKLQKAGISATSFSGGIRYRF